jgi:hypothetical protein
MVLSGARQGGFVVSDHERYSHGFLCLNSLTEP